MQIYVNWRDHIIGKNGITYDKRFTYITGSVTSAILLQQMMYWYDLKGKFYKFISPCTHEKYKTGDSRCEELGFSPEEFDSAIKNIGFKLGKNKNTLTKDQAIVIYYTDSDRLTHYELNEELLNKLIYNYYLVIRDSPITKKQGIPQLLLYTETTTETTTESVDTVQKKEVLTLEKYKENWNSIKEIKQFGEPQKGFPVIRKITPLIQDAWNVIKKQLSDEDIIYATNRYIEHLENLKKDKDGYYTHRFGILEFLKQSNGIRKYINL